MFYLGERKPAGWLIWCLQWTKGSSLGAGLGAGARHLVFVGRGSGWRARPGRYPDVRVHTSGAPMLAEGGLVGRDFPKRDKAKVSDVFA